MIELNEELTYFNLNADTVIPIELLRDVIGRVSYLTSHTLDPEKILSIVGNKLDTDNVVWEDDDGEEIELRGPFLTRLQQYWKHVKCGLGARRDDWAAFKSEWNFRKGSFINDIPASGYFDVHGDIDWSPGTYGEETSSCWWRYSQYSEGRVVMRHAFSEGRGFALRLYNEDKRPTSRCFCLYYGQNNENIAYFNWYSKSVESVHRVFGAILLSLLPQNMYKIVGNDALNLHTSRIYKNSYGMSVVPTAFPMNTSTVDIHSFDTYRWGSNIAWEDDRLHWIRR